MREATHMIGLEPHRLQQFHHPILPRLAGGGEVVNDQRLRNDRADGVARVQ